MKKTVAVMGLGYVGFPLAELLTKTKKYDVIGVDIDKKKVAYAAAALKKGQFKATSDFKALAYADIVVICVPTPVFHNFQPDYGPLESAVRAVAANPKYGQLVIVESTINPGTCEEVAMPILKKSGAVAGKDFLLAHCPERIDPGNKKWTLINIPRNVGGIDEQSTAEAAAFYRSFLKSEVRVLNSIKAAEATKIIENTFRDINIAYVNELAMSFDALGIDLLEVIEGAKSKPFAFMPHYPGVGVGGHCIPVDPYYLIKRARVSGFEHQFLKMARKVNNGMPKYTVALLEKEVAKLGLKLGKITVGVLGLAYKKDIEDLRESPALKLLKILKEKGVKFLAFDPFIPHKSDVKNETELFEKCEAVILATNHTRFTEIKPAQLKRAGVKIVIDGRNCLPKEEIQKQGIAYKGIGH